MKNKLDLNNLLAKYEGISGNSSNNYYSPARQYDPPPQDDFYQPREREPTYETQVYQQRTVEVVNRIKDQLRSETREMNFYAEGAIKKIHEDFKRQHEAIRREILQLLERAFQENQRRIRQELVNQGKLEPPEFAAVKRKIEAHEDTIDRLSQQLRGPNYRKAIADTVLHDFNVEITELRTAIKAAKDNYLSNFGQVEPERARIDCIREDLQRLFKISKRHANLIQKVFFDANHEKQPERASQPPPRRNEGQYPPAPPQRQRKSFFNFGFE